MSLNRKNITWQSANGTWSLGFYAYHHVNQDSDDFDPEWDVDYEDEFNWVSTGHATSEAADDSRRDPNPGGVEYLEYTPANAPECAALDALAQKYLASKSQ